MTLPEKYNYPEMDEFWLDKNDIELLSLKKHPIQPAMIAGKEGLTIDDASSLPLPYLRGIDEAYLNYKPKEGKFNKGYATATYEVSQNDLWFYCHFLGDPVMPGSQGQDIIYQLAGMYSTLRCEISGRSRALGGSFKFFGQILPTSKKIFYRIDIKRRLIKKNMLFFEGSIAVDTPDNIIYSFDDCTIGFYTKEELGIFKRGKEYYNPDWENIKEQSLKYIQQSKDFYDHNNK